MHCTLHRYACPSHGQAVKYRYLVEDIDHAIWHIAVGMTSCRSRTVGYANHAAERKAKQPHAHEFSLHVERCKLVSSAIAAGLVCAAATRDPKAFGMQCDKQFVRQAIHY